MTCSGRRRSNGFKLKDSKFQLHIKKKFFPEGDETLEQVAREAVHTLSPGMFKARLHEALSSLV